jgi:protein-S-isoprenylcysteine O-methyltransferase Ste14
MHGEYRRAIAPRLFLTLVHLAAAGVVAWLLLGGGLQVLAAWRCATWPLASPERRWLRVGCALVYFLRVNITVSYLVQREFGWGEATIIGAWIAFIHVLFAYLGGTNPKAISSAVVTIALVLYGAGSVLNTGSELQRKWWKDRSENRGRLYTQGLFRYATHINYFGDELLFTGYALFTGIAWALLVPLVMAAGFVFFNIPQLDKHLHDHYGSDFEIYAGRTKIFVPFIY